ncbi:beta-1,3-glucosyltransferase-like [Aplysia californica]|uniref:Beta-1,3-glucosyltransferase-like n=1 Tax=Aplysia californica TaxID=6500 RepID=A0ABM1W2X3_APLCA|nr:beta-1,3-glucosyltransferase-like [Aplysia californica]
MAPCLILSSRSQLTETADVIRLMSWLRVSSCLLVHSLRKRLTSEKLFSDFSIDPKHELALFVWDNGKGSNLTHVQGFCSADESADPNCVTTQRDKFPDCGAPVAEDELFVAVKTCHKFHESRGELFVTSSMSLEVSCLSQVP